VLYKDCVFDFGAAKDEEILRRKNDKEKIIREIGFGFAMFVQI
jgi:hypothetical protein